MYMYTLSHTHTHNYCSTSHCTHLCYSQFTYSDFCSILPSFTEMIKCFVDTKVVEAVLRQPRIFLIEEEQVEVLLENLPDAILVENVDVHLIFQQWCTVGCRRCHSKALETTVHMQDLPTWLRWITVNCFCHGSIQSVWDWSVYQNRDIGTVDDTVHPKYDYKRTKLVCFY